MAGDVVPRASASDGEAADITFPEANIVAVRAVAGALESALGPAARDKLIVPMAENEDGATMRVTSRNIAAARGSKPRGVD